MTCIENKEHFGAVSWIATTYLYLEIAELLQELPDACERPSSITPNLQALLNGTNMKTLCVSTGMGKSVALPLSYILKERKGILHYYWNFSAISNAGCSYPFLVFFRSLMCTLIHHDGIYCLP